MAIPSVLKSGGHAKEFRQEEVEQGEEDVKKGEMRKVKEERNQH